MGDEFEDRRKEFSDTKNKYEKLRDFERGELSIYMSNKGFNVVGEHPELGANRRKSRAGKGKSYSSGGRLDPPFNLINWKWVELESDDETVIISLNPYDIDPNSGNIHVLYDRIGIYKMSKEKALLHSTKTVITKYELPLSKEDMEQLYNIIKEL